MDLDEIGANGGISISHLRTVSSARCHGTLSLEEADASMILLESFLSDASLGQDANPGLP